MPLRHLLLASTLLLAASAQATTPAPAKPYRSPQQILDASSPADWRPLDPTRTLYMDLPAGRVVIELAPDFAPAHVAQIRTLAREHFWDGTSVYRVQDNFVAQFGDAEGEDPARAKPLGSAKAHLPAEFQRSGAGLHFDALPDADGWAKQVGFVAGFPAARDPASGQVWLAHCYGMVGAARNDADDSSLASELYAVIGQAPRQIDRNITVVGRVVQGMQYLSALPRGPEPMGVYTDPAERTPILAVTLASELPSEQRLELEALRTDTQTFRDLVEARRNRVDAFYKRPAGHIDLCNVPLPVQAQPAER